ncbi:hypothetical protein PRK78_001982 [Emydomyces testavorans]|uniref:Glycosyltransferase family 25 protein n=1 Tax=Emydomyces testavorans TaxID=2070801 RepID=A0AAF0DDE6_9EURO|nr:hypothetical protein PRK78_001982 [Emydomyces testavorans]
MVPVTMKSLKVAARLVFDLMVKFGRIYVVNLPSRTDRSDALVLMSALTGIKLDWIDGVNGHTVQEKALPPPAPQSHFHLANIGSWRAHLNALRAVVENNLGSALILEDDADWDVRIKSQLRDFALASRTLLQPLLSQPSSFADPTLRDPSNSPGMPQSFDLNQLPQTVPPMTSPYGDNWDILWLGHCGTEFPNSELQSKAELSGQLPRGRVAHYNDATVPKDEHLLFLSKEDDPRKTYPPHTRVIHHAMGSICSLGYAVSQKGARRLLYELGVKSFDGPFDLMLRDVCEGVKGRDRATCLTVQPQLFNHHRPAGNTSFYSDISGHGQGIVDHPFTHMIRWSTRLNLPNLFNGKTEFNDQFPD